MRNIIGQPVSGNDYFKREKLINKIYRRLDNDSDVYLSAPRRVGKTSSMFFLRDQPRENYVFIYVNTESIDDVELYFKRLFDVLLTSDAVKNSIKNKEKAQNLFNEIAERVKEIELFGIGIKLENKAQQKYSEAFAELVKKLNIGTQKIVIMVDEFPSTVENIHREKGINQALHFLKLNRTIRQESISQGAKENRIQFMYTGSIGLQQVVNELNVPESINDLNEIEVEPLSKTEARLFTQKLLSVAKVPIHNNDIGVIDFLIEKIRWLMPFYIQLTVQELIDEYDNNATAITEKIVETAFEKTCNRRNNIHFESYYKRLQDAYSEAEYKLAIRILNLIAEKDKVSKEELFELGDNQKQVNSILERLDYDGYIGRINGSYYFLSPILRSWWNKYIRE